MLTSTAILSTALASASPYQKLDAACRMVPGDRALLATAYKALPCFGDGVPSLPAGTPLPQGELQRITGLPSTAFAPRKRAASGAGRVAPLEAAAGLGVGLLLSVYGKLDFEPTNTNVFTDLRRLDAPDLILLSLSLLLCVTTTLALLDKIILNARLLEALALLRPGRRSAVARHEAGHFLCAYLLGLPVQACELNPVRSMLATDPNLQLRVGTVFHSPAIEALRDGRRARDEDVDSACIVLMGGIAAEAMLNGSAEGGLSDERALQSLVNAHHVAQEPAAGALDVREVRSRARWAAASAVLLLRDHRDAFDALDVALREGRSVSECVEAIEAVLEEVRASNGA